MRRLGRVLVLVGLGSVQARAQVATDAQRPATPIPLVQAATPPAQQAATKAGPRQRTPAESALAAQNQQIRVQLRREFDKKVQNQLGLNTASMNRLRDVDAKFDKQRTTLDQQLSQVTQELRQSLQREGNTADIQSKDSALEMQRYHLKGQRDDIDSIERNELQVFLQPREWIRFLELKAQFLAEVETETGVRMPTSATVPLVLPPPARRGGGPGGAAGAAAAKPPVKPDTGQTSSTRSPGPPRF